MRHRQILIISTYLFIKFNLKNKCAENIRTLSKNSHFANQIECNMLLSVCLCMSLFEGSYGDSQAYGPQSTTCPANIMRHANNELSYSEANWVSKRDTHTHDGLVEWLSNSRLSEFDPNIFLHTIARPNVSSIRIGMAFSGGGFRAMLNGAGELAAFDSRTSGSTSPGGMGGLLQSATYISGLSGGSWLVGSVVGNGWETIPDLQANKSIWNFQNPFTPTVKRRFFQSFQLDWIWSIATSLIKKISLGFNSSITDVWGRMLSAQMFSGADSGIDLHWSDMANKSGMSQYKMPMPILVADSFNEIDGEVSSDGNITVSLNSTLYEITPFEFGSWDPSVSAFIQTRYMGTATNNGSPASKTCTIGFDNVGFLIGASSTVFNRIAQLFSQGSGPLQNLYRGLIAAVGGQQYLETAPVPNPFKNLIGVDEIIKKADFLTLVDGGEDGQNVPLAPLLQPARGVDVVIAMDNSADTETNWPNGTAIWATYMRQFNSQGNGSVVPDVPNPTDFWNMGLSRKPTFFQCTVDPDFMGEVAPTPLMIYLPNMQKTYASNTSTWKLSYTNDERDSMIRNGYNIATQNNGTSDPEWRSCVACAIILREQQRRGDKPTSQCQQCLNRYCYDPPT